MTKHTISEDSINQEWQLGWCQWLSVQIDLFGLPWTSSVTDNDDLESSWGMSNGRTDSSGPKEFVPPHDPCPKTKWRNKNDRGDERRWKEGRPHGTGLDWSNVEASQSHIMEVQFATYLKILWNYTTVFGSHPYPQPKRIISGDWNLTCGVYRGIVFASSRRFLIGHL